MLILTRRASETVMIGNDTTVTVLGIKGNQVRLGVVAPKEVSVHREEIWERIRAEELDACTICKGSASVECAKHKHYLDRRK